MRKEAAMKKLFVLMALIVLVPLGICGTLGIKSNRK
jgi:hypothetical protein